MTKPARIFIRFGFLVFVGITVLYCFGGIIAPSSEQWALSHTLSTALSGARSVMFVEFTPYYFDADKEKIVQHEVVLQRKSATPSQIVALRSATSEFLVYSTSYSQAGCFTPHHRVEIVRHDGSNFRFEICFHCRNFRFNNEYDQRIPSAWLPRLQQLFSDLGMRSRTEGEYLQPVQPAPKA